jgi:hypothetical protein
MTYLIFLTFAWSPNFCRTRNAVTAPIDLPHSIIFLNPLATTVLMTSTKFSKKYLVIVLITNHKWQNLKNYDHDLVNRTNRETSHRPVMEWWIFPRYNKRLVHAKRLCKSKMIHYE